MNIDIKLAISSAIQKKSSPMEIQKICGGYNSCHKDENGKRLGPLVGYNGRYETAEGDKQWVGDIYANFAKAEEYPWVLEYFAEQMRNTLSSVLCENDVFCGAQFGGYAFSLMLGLACDRRVIKAEKKIIEPATKYEREKTDLVFGRH